MASNPALEQFIRGLKIFIADLQAYINTRTSPTNTQIPQKTAPKTNDTPRDDTSTNSQENHVETQNTLLWDTWENCRHSIRVICDQEGLTVDQKNKFSQTIHCESNYDPSIVMYNCTKAFVRSTQYNPLVHGRIISKDIGICQVNSYWHIGPGKDFTSEDYVLQNPEAVVRWAARVFKTSPREWICYKKGLFKNYTA